MGYQTLRQCVEDLKRHRHLLVVDEPLSANLELAEIQRRVYSSGGPALLFTNVNRCRFPMVSNLFGTLERARFIFRDTYEDVRRAINCKADPTAPLKQPWAHRRLPLVGWRMLPRRCGVGGVLENQTTLDQLPALVSWPRDGGPYVTLPQVYSEDPAKPGLGKSNLGMYRVQLSGNEFVTNRELGLHYQIHRGIGVQHQKAIAAGKPFPVNIFVGGNPAMTLAAVMPLPEGMSELGFAGALAGRRISLVHGKHVPNGLPVYRDADFCISGVIDGRACKPEGPFGDHLGYYSLTHPFPLMQVRAVYHRHDAIWPFTVVGRPPQEDTTFGQLIHDLTGTVIPTVIPGIDSVHAVDAAGVHPLLLAIGNERYNAYQNLERPQELLTQANAILGQGQMSLAKYLFILNRADVPKLDIHHITEFLLELLRRIDWQRDLHFQTRTTIDTLDYSGEGFNQGSKVVWAAVGPPRRELPTEVPATLRLPIGFSNPRLPMPGILCVQSPPHPSLRESVAPESRVENRSGWTVQDGPFSLSSFCRDVSPDESLNRFPLVVLCDDSNFAAASEKNFLWVTFTRSNPAVDTDGIGATTVHKHWGCRGSLVIDARIKSHHAPPLIEDPEVTNRIDALAAAGGPLSRWL
ncbi:MAG: UbiD family decarboxylase [Planctomycetaceae bacterium]|nr:UbiD family decarboxylase [Planctomycetaceae bacterium]